MWDAWFHPQIVYFKIEHPSIINKIEKSCPVRPYFIVLSEQYYDSPVRLFIFGKIPCPVRLFHTVRLLDSPEYIVAWQKY